MKVPTGKGWEDEGRCKLDTIRLRKAENMESKGIIFKRNRVVKNVQDQRRAEKNETSTNSLNLNLGEKQVESGREKQGERWRRRRKEAEEEQQEEREWVMEHFEREVLSAGGHANFRG